MKVGSDGKIRRQGCRYDKQAMNIFQVLHHYGGPRVINFLQVNNRAPTSNPVTVSNYVKKVTVSNYVKKASFQTASCKAQLNADAWWVSLCESLRPFAANHGGLLAAILCELEDECFILFIYFILFIVFNLIYLIYFKREAPFRPPFSAGARPPSN